MPAGAAQHGTQPRLQLGQVERLEDVVVRAGVEAAHPRLDAVARGQDQRGQVRAATATQAPQHLHAVHVGQAEVEDHRVVDRCCRSRQRLLAARDRIDGESPPAQVRRDHLAHGPVILDEQHPHDSQHPRIAAPATMALTTLTRHGRGHEAEFGCGHCLASAAQGSAALAGNWRCCACRVLRTVRATAREEHRRCKGGTAAWQPPPGLHPARPGSAMLPATKRFMVTSCDGDSASEAVSRTDLTRR